MPGESIVNGFKFTGFRNLNLDLVRSAKKRFGSLPTSLLLVEERMSELSSRSQGQSHYSVLDESAPKVSRQIETLQSLPTVVILNRA